MKYKLLIVSLLFMPLTMFSESFVVKKNKEEMKNKPTKQECVEVYTDSIKLTNEMFQKITDYQKKLFEELEKVLRDGTVCSRKFLGTVQKGGHHMQLCIKQLGFSESA